MATILDLVAELQRLQLMNGLEERLSRAGYVRVAGVDEVGRGCLAGPVVAAAVITGDGPLLPSVDDSKELSAARREVLAERIRRRAAAWGVAAVSAATIDRINILEATRLAMTRALDSLEPSPDCALVDVVTLAGRPYPCLGVVRGDRLSYSVACASILAKVERDRMMTALDGKHPQYGFARHKGYGSPDHLSALGRFGPTPDHRLTFRSVLPRASRKVGA